VEPIAWHLTFRLEVDRDIAPSSAQRRILARTVSRVARPFPMLAFRWADTHGHVLTMGDRRRAAELARRIEIALQKALKPGVGFARVHFTPVYDVRHLKTAFFYVLGQDRHHGLNNDPLHEASNLPDLLGVRTLAVWTAANVKKYLPRVKREHLLAIAGCSDEAAPQLTDLADAAAAAVGLSDLKGNTVGARRARRAAVEVGDALSNSALAGMLGLSRQGVGRIRKRPAHAITVDAVRGQLRVRAASVNRSAAT
jgi:hypothetical protein